MKSMIRYPLPFSVSGSDPNIFMHLMSETEGHAVVFLQTVDQSSWDVQEAQQTV